MEHFIHLTGPKPPLDAEFRGEHGHWRAFHSEGLTMGRCFGSKSAYSQFNPGCIFIANANVFGLRRGKLWWGDLDLALDKPRLQAVAKRMGTTLYVLGETDGRFENAALPPREVIRRARWHTGGPRQLLGLAGLCRQSRITLRGLANRVKIPLARLKKPMEPEEVYDFWRRAWYAGLWPRT